LGSGSPIFHPTARLRVPVRRELAEMIGDIDVGIEEIRKFLKDERFMEARDSSQVTLRKIYEVEVKMRGSK